LRGGYTPGVISLLLALIRNRNVVVPLGPAPVRNREVLLKVSRARALFQFEADDAWTFDEMDPGGDHPLLRQLRQAREPGLILGTSGSTGASKTALLGFTRLLERFRRERSPYRTLVFMELDHIGGINSLFHVLCDGGTLISVDARTPRAVCLAIERYRVQLLPTTPTFLNMLLIGEVDKEHDLSSLELITYGTEPMPASTLRALNRAFPAVRCKQTYGMSELGILPTSSENSQSLWLRIGGEGSETKVVDGTLWVRAQSAMLGYLDAPSPFDADGWINTGDAVESEGGYLRILGRASEVINVGGEKVYPAEVESVLLQLPNVGDVTVCGKPNAVTGRVVTAVFRVVVPEAPERLEQRMREFCMGRLEDHKVPVLIEIDDSDHHGPRFKKTRDLRGGKGAKRDE
jgi:acyl-CoA synthetase (AMP-forming)/AMP-acid ligase II